MALEQVLGIATFRGSNGAIIDGGSSGGGGGSGNSGGNSGGGGSDSSGGGAAPRSASPTEGVMGFFHEVYKEGLPAEGKGQTPKQRTAKSGGAAAGAPKLLAFLSDELDHGEMRVQYEVNFGTYVEMRAADLWRATATTSRRLQGCAGAGVRKRGH